jgi:hypothetical protein
LFDAIDTSEKRGFLMGRLAERQENLKFPRRGSNGSGDLPVGHFCVESLLQKYFAFPVGQIISTNSRHPTPPEGRWPSSRTRGGLRWTRQRFAGNGIAGRVMSL